MKCLINYITLALLVVIINACKKDGINEKFNPPPPPPPLIKNTAPLVEAGEEVIYFTQKITGNEINLNGWAYDSEKNIQSYLWEKISGPNSGLIENLYNPTTKVSGLDTGVYQFMFTVTDSLGLYNKDIKKATIQLIERNQFDDSTQFVFKNMIWISPWNNCLEIKNFINLVPAGTPFSVFIQRFNKPEWIPVPPDDINLSLQNKYDYFVEKRPFGAGMYTYGSLYICYYGFDINDHPSVKIVY